MAIAKNFLLSPLKTHKRILNIAVEIVGRAITLWRINQKKAMNQFTKLIQKKLSKEQQFGLLQFPNCDNYMGSNREKNNIAIAIL